MADVTLSYKGSPIAELSDTGSKTVKTAGKYCEADILLNYLKPSLPAPVIEALSVIANGTYTPPEGVDGYAPVTVNVPSGGEFPGKTGTFTPTVDINTNSNFQITHNLGRIPNIIAIFTEQELTSLQGYTVEMAIGSVNNRPSMILVTYGSGHTAYEVKHAGSIAMVAKSDSISDESFIVSTYNNSYYYRTGITYRWIVI